jgi:hypothetical protein
VFGELVGADGHKRTENLVFFWDGEIVEEEVTSKIVYPAGICSGNNERRRGHKSWLDELWSLDKASTLLLQSSGNWKPL